MMLRLWVAFLSTFAAISTAATLTAEAYELFVSPMGNDEWSGKLADPNGDRSDGPLATLSKARDVMRGYLRRTADNRAESTLITLRAGVYRITDTLQLGTADSGTAQWPVIYRAYADERPVISGAVPVTDFRPLSANIFQADLSSLISEPALVRLVLHEGKRMPLARWPNRDLQDPVGGGWAYVDGQRTNKPSDTVAGETEANRQIFTLRNEDRREWRNPGEGELFIFARYNYWNDLVPIAQFNSASGQLSTTEPCSYAIRPGDRYFVQGMREELDAPGEWYIDRSSSKLLIYSRASELKITLDVAVAPTLVATRAGAHDIRFEGLTFTACNGPAMKFNDSTQIVVSRCKILHVGDKAGHGVAFFNGSLCRLSDCEIEDVGGSGLYTTGGTYAGLAAAGHVAENNHIHHTGVITKHSAGIWLGGIGNVAVKNSIHDCPRMGIMLPYTTPTARSTIELNHVYRVNLETQDSGAIYATGRDWLAGRGHVIRHNFVHDSIGYGWNGQRWLSPFYAWGIYLDDACSATEVTGNIVARCSRGCLMIHSGQHNRIENNIFVSGGQQQIEMRGWKANYAPWQAAMATMEKGYIQMKDDPAWRDLHLVPPAQAAAADGNLMVGNSIQRNIIVYAGRGLLTMDLVHLPLKEFSCDKNLIYARATPPAFRIDEKRTINLAQWQELGFDRGSRQADPRFKDVAKDDYTLDPSSLALKLGFVPIPFDTIAK